MKILIVGGGIAGLTLSAFLKKSGADVTIVEKAPKWATIGYVITLFPNGLSILKRLGLDEKTINQSKVLTDYRVKDMSGRDLWGFDFSSLRASLPVIEIERSALHRTLVDANKDARMIMDTRVVALSQDADGVDVELSNGSKDRFDLVVGADGIGSSVRSFITPRVKRSYTGFTYWLARVKSLPTMQKGIMQYLGSGKFFGVFPSGDADDAVVSFGLPAKEHSYGDPLQALAVIRKRFRGSDKVVDAALDKISLDPSDLFHSDDEEIRDKRWYSGRVVLLGDAVHALSPILGMGASMAMEDACVLSLELSKASVKEGLVAYKKRRQPRIAMLEESSIAIHKAISASRSLGPLFAPLFRLFIGPQYKKVVTKLSRQNP